MVLLGLLGSVCCSHPLRSFPGEIQNWPPYMEGKERAKKEATHSRLIGDRFNKQGNLRTRLVLGGCKMRFLHLPARILEIYTEALPGFNHVSVMALTTPDSLKAACPWKSCCMGRVGWSTSPGQGRGWGACSCLGPASGPVGGHILQMLSSSSAMISQ